jgi:orotate phosphoribosyltransferase-like protein
MCALLLQKPGLTTEWLAEELDLSKNRVEELESKGEKLLKV